MSRRRFLSSLGAGAAALAAPWAGSRMARAAGERPNILLIMADDVGREVLGCYGGTSYKTPHLDRLAERGIRFTHCYSCPVCAPSRRKIMTGRYGFRTGGGWGTIPAHEKTFGHVLGDAGYATAIAGKWQMCLFKRNPDHAAEMGFDQSCLFGWHEGPRYHDPLVYWNGEKRVLEGRYGPDVYTDFLIDLMERNKEKPFLAYFPMACCHAVSDDFMPRPPRAPDGKYQSYAELVEVMDRCVGRLVAALERLGLRQKTVVLYTTDNGSPGSFYVDLKPDGKHFVSERVVSKMGERTVRGGKGQMTDGGTRVPLIANWPGTAPAGTVCDDLIDFSDFLPTLADLAGAELPDDRPIDGVSFAPQLRGKQGRPRRWCYNQWRGKAWARTHRWKLYRDGKLFDVQKDPAEKHPIPPGEGGDEAEKARKMLAAVLERLKAG
ncbi:MAG: sulfatase-like hydrolase/transferase [Candidatus Brocadiia bacterium]